MDESHIGLRVMARKFASAMGSDNWSWETLKCEDTVIIDTLLRLQDRLSRPPRLDEVIKNFVERGRAISEKDLTVINQLLERAGKETLVLFETEGDAYSGQTGVAKANLRRKIMDQLKASSDKRREQLVAEQRQVLGQAAAQTPNRDRRRAPRYSLRADVTVLHGGAELPCQIVNVSVSGLLANLPIPGEAGQEVAVIRTGLAVRITGRLVRIGPYGTAIAFNSQASGRALLEHLLPSSRS